jgi:DNA polymerase III subunit epsilon
MDEKRIGVFQRLFGSRMGRSNGQTAGGREELYREAYSRQMVIESQRKKFWDIPLTESIYVILDTETTGFDSRKDFIFALGAVKMKADGERLDTFYSLIRIPEETFVHPSLLACSAITRDEITRAPLVSQVLRSFLEFAGDAIWVAHYAKHDVRFIDAAFRQCWKVQLDVPVIDTDRVGKLLYPGVENYTLEHWLQHFSVQVTNRHHALSDALVTAELWKHFLTDLKRNRFETIGELFEEILYR